MMTPAAPRAVTMHRIAGTSLADATFAGARARMRRQGGQGAALLV